MTSEIILTGLRTIISSLIVGIVSFGNTLQASVSNGQPPTKWQLYSAIIGGVVLMLNDIKSRVTPTVINGNIVSKDHG